MLEIGGRLGAKSAFNLNNPFNLSSIMWRWHRGPDPITILSKIAIPKCRQVAIGCESWQQSNVGNDKLDQVIEGTNHPVSHAQAL